MKNKILASMLAGALAMLPIAANAGWGGGGVGPYGSPITIYGWQNHTYEFIEKGAPGSQSDYSEIRGNAANIGFLGFVDTGIEGLKVTWRCEQFTYLNDYGGGVGWCNRNSKVGISGSFGEIMFATWLLPYNEMVAAWVDPWYDAGNASHTNIMGSVGANTIFYNVGNFHADADFDYAGAGTGSYNMGFNRRQEEIVQYMGSFDKISVRLAYTVGDQDETSVTGGSGSAVKVDPVIYSGGIAYSDGPIWLAATYQKHEEWAAANIGSAAGTRGDMMSDSEATSWRIAGRYIADLGGGSSLTLSAMFENVEYELMNVADGAMAAFGFGTSVFDGETAGGNIEFYRDAWLVSGKFAPGGPFDFRFMYAEADDLDVTGTLSTNNKSETGAETMLVGLFYALGDSTELSLSYIEVDNDKYGTYGTGIGGTGLGTVNNETEIIALGFLTMF